MRKVAEAFIVILVGLMMAMPMPALADSSARIIPTGKVSLLADGKEVNQFRSEMPLPEGLLKVSGGSCLVQTDGLQLVAQDGSVFSLAETGQRWDMNVSSGRVDYAMRAEAKPIAFQTPHDLIQTQRAPLAAADGVVRGFIVVTEKGTELIVQEGALQVASSEGTKVVEAGQSIMLAAGAGAAGAAAGAAGATSSVGSSGLAAVGAGVAVIGGVAAGVALNSGDDVTPTKHDVSPF